MQKCKYNFIKIFIIRLLSLRKHNNYYTRMMFAKHHDYYTFLSLSNYMKRSQLLLGHHKMLHNKKASTQQYKSNNSQKLLSIRSGTSKQKIVLIKKSKPAIKQQKSIIDQYNKPKDSQFDYSAYSEDFDLSTSKSDDGLTEQEKRQALKDFGFDGLFNIDDDYFNAARAMEEDDEHEEKPLDLGAELGLNSDLNSQLLSNNDQKVIDKNNKCMLQQNLNQDSRQKKNKQINKGALAEAKTNNMDESIQVIKEQMNLLNEGNVIEVAQQVSSKITSEQLLHTLSQCLKELIFNDQMQGCYIQATCAVFLKALRLYLTPMQLQTLYNQIIENKNMFTMQFIAFGLHFDVFHEHILQESLEQTKNIKLDQILTILRSVLLDLSKDMRQRLLSWYKITFYENNNGQNQDTAQQLHEQLFTDIMHHPQKPTLYESAYFMLLDQQMKTINQQASILGLRQQMDILWTGKDITSNQAGQLEYHRSLNNSLMIDKPKLLTNSEGFMLSASKILKAPGEALGDALNNMLEFPSDQSLRGLQIALDQTKDQQEIMRRIGQFTEKFLQNKQANIGSLRVYECVKQRNPALVRQSLSTAMARIDQIGSTGAQNLARAISVAEDVVLYSNSRQLGLRMLLVHDLAVIWAINGKKELVGADINGLMRRLQDDKWASKLIAATGVSLQQLISSLSVIGGR